MTEKRNIYFIDHNGNHRLLEEDVTHDEVMVIISNFCEAHKFVSYYIRMWETKTGLMFDVGSHDEFFLWGYAD